MNKIASHCADGIEAQAERIRRLLDARQLEAALSCALSQLTLEPTHRDILYLCAVSQRHLQRIDDALTTLKKLESHHPRYGRLYQERGMCLVAKREANLAIEAFLHAVNLNPALLDSWRMLEGLYRMIKREENARLATQHIATLSALPPEITAATRLLHDGDLEPAEKITRKYLLEHKLHVEAMVLLARIGIARRVYDDAETLLEAATGLAPDYRAARLDYARVLAERHDFPRAHEQIRILLACDSQNREYRVVYAAVLAGLGRQDQAAELYEQLLAEGADSPDLHLSAAHALKTLGRAPLAVDHYHAAVRVRPEFGEAYWSLANLKTYKFTDAEISNMRSIEASVDVARVDRWHLCFALGKALEDRGNFEESFEYYTRGNALKRADSRYRAEIIENNTRLQKEVCTREFFAIRSGCGAPSAAPIFIIGLPRSGSTLIEQILASHSNVEGTQELPNVPRIVQELNGNLPDLNDPRYPGVLLNINSEEFRRLGERYITETMPFRNGRPRFIDKMPNNFRHLGLIHLMLPNARVIDARREPMSCCFGNLKQLFASGQEFSYSIEDIARYYRTYLDLMEHWDRVLPGAVLRVHHEDVVRDLPGSVERILKFCDLPFESACLDFHKTERSIRTASSEQVRRPIYREGLEQWRNYEQWLDPLKAALGDALWRYRAAAGADR